MKTVAFYGSCEARSSLVLVSSRISRPYDVHEIHAKFPAGSNNLLKLRLYESPDDQAPTSGAPSGVSMLADYGQVDYVVGDDDFKWVRHHVVIDTGGSYLKVYAVNDDFYEHDVDVQILIGEDVAEG